MYKPGIESNLKKKLEEILQNPIHYKPLSQDMKHLRRVHIDSLFVLVFSINENDEVVLFVDIDHHAGCPKTQNMCTNTTHFIPYR